MSDLPDSVPPEDQPLGEPMGPVRSMVGFVGEQIIYGLIRVFGRRTSLAEAPWLRGPLGGDYIGDQPYHDCARQEGLAVQRESEEGGLIEDFDRLAGPQFDVQRIHPLVRDFYEHTARYRMDVWTQTYFPANVALWLLVTTISRRVNQLNFPVRALDTARGMTSEIVLLTEPDGTLRYTGWFRKIADTERVLYTGFYMLETIPEHSSPVVKVVFPMPDGNATVLLRPEVGEALEGDASGGGAEDGNRALVLTSDGRGFGDVGFYRLQKMSGRLRVWRVGSLRERFQVYVDGDGVLRCDHTIRYLGLQVLALHYRIERRRIERRRIERRRIERRRIEKRRIADRR